MPDKISPPSWYVYLLECANGKLYTGITNDLDKRFKTHLAGKGAVYTRVNPPVKMIAALPCSNRSEATKIELKVKKLRASEKRRSAESWPLQKNLPLAPDVKAAKLP